MAQERDREDFGSTLCDECAELDFETIFSSSDEAFKERKGLEFAEFVNQRHRQRGIVLYSFGDRLANISRCGLCQFFRQMRVDPDGAKRYDLVAFSVAGSYAIGCDPWKQDKSTATSWNSITRSAFLMVCPHTRFINDYTANRAPASKDCAIFRCSSGPSHDGSFKNGIWGRQIGQYIDLRVVTEWLNFCRDNHELTCSRQTGNVRGLRLIDCISSPPVLVKPTRAERYVALSYVWGPYTAGTWPKVVLDAMQVTIDLGVRYLWVDRHCIDQNNPAEKHYMITQMANIYDGAELTIVAAAGSDATHGLPGVGSTPRRPQPSFQLRKLGLYLVSSFQDPREAIRDSTWNSRGWTFQEAMLSCRLLFFTDEQVYWECSAMALQETLTTPLPLIHTKPTREEGNIRSRLPVNSGVRMEYYMRPGLFLSRVDDMDWIPISSERPDTSVRKMCLRFDNMMQSFSRRTLSYESDTFNAVTGIFQKYLSNPATPLKQILGLPVLCYNYTGSLSTRRLLSMSFAHSLASWGSVRSGLDPSLAGPDGSAISRRPQFPSWTWAGWRGPLDIETLFGNEEDILRRSATNYRSEDWWAPKLRLQTSQGVMIDWQELLTGRVVTSCRLVIEESYVLKKLDLSRYRQNQIGLSIAIRSGELESQVESGKLCLYMVSAKRQQEGMDFEATFVILRPLLVVENLEDGAWERVGSLKVVLSLNPNVCSVEEIITSLLPVSRCTRECIVV